MARKPKSTATASSWVRATGRKTIFTAPLQDDYDLIRRAAKADGRSMSQFLITHGVTAAKKILKNLENPH